MNQHDQRLIGLRTHFPDALEVQESGTRYIFLPKLTINSAGRDFELAGLLRPTAGPDGYQSRLFLSESIPNKQINWTTCAIAGRNWHTWSYQGVATDLSYVEMIGAHVRALK